MLIYTVRHGETYGNVKRICDDNPLNNSTLTLKGITQVETLANKLKNFPFEVIFVSEFLRTRRTAEIINKFHDKTLIVDKRLNDRQTGLSGRPVDEFFEAIDKSNNPWTVKLGEGESFEEEKERVKSFLDDLKEKDHKNVLIVAHEEPIKIIRGFFKNLSNKEVWNMKVGNAEFFKYNH